MHKTDDDERARVYALPEENMPDLDAQTFRNYLVRSGAAQLILKMLVAINETKTGRGTQATYTDEPIQKLKTLFDDDRVPTIAEREDKFDVAEALETRDQLRHQVEQLKTKLAASHRNLADATRKQQAPQLDELLHWYAADPAAESKELDVAKLATVLSRCGLVEVDEPDAAEQPTAPRAAETYEVPAGFVSAATLADWAADSFVFSNGLTLARLLECVSPEVTEPPRLQPEEARALSEAVTCLASRAAAVEREI